MLSEQELDEIKRYVLRELPRVLEQDPQFVLFIEGIISEKFPRRDEFARLLEEFTSFRQEQRESFQRVDQRFEQIDRRFEAIDRRFEAIDRRFEAIDRRFEQMNQRLEKVEQRLGELSQEMHDLRDWVELIAGRLRTRVGRSLEDIVAGALRLGLQRPDIDPQNVKLRQRISDPTGLVFKAGKQKEADLIARDGELLVFEVKSAPDVDDVDELADKTELVRLQNPDKRVTGILIAVGAEADVRQRCQEREVLLIP